MPFRKSGRILHSYRDGRGLACQRRLAILWTRRAWSGLRCPEAAIADLSQLRDQAANLQEGLEAKPVLADSACWASGHRAGNIVDQRRSAICVEGMLVQSRLRDALERGVQVRNLVPVRSRFLEWFDQVALAVAVAFQPEFNEPVEQV